MLEGKGLLQSWPQRHHLPPNCEQVPSSSPRFPGILNSSHQPGVSQPEISSPEETHGTPETVPVRYTWETQRPGEGRYIRYTAYLGQCTLQAPSHLNGLGLGRAQNAQPIWVLQSTLEPERYRPGKYMLPWAVSNQAWSIRCEHSPHLLVVLIFSVPPSPQHS